MSQQQQNIAPTCSCPVCKGQCPRCRTTGCGMCNRCMHARCPLCPTCAGNIERYEDTGALEQESQKNQGTEATSEQNKVVPVKKHKKIITFDRVLLVSILILLIYMLFVRNR